MSQLNPALAYLMGRKMRLQPGEVVCDALCGTATILQECLEKWPFCNYIGGDVDPEGLSNASIVIKIIICFCFFFFRLKGGIVFLYVLFSASSTLQEMFCLPMFLFKSFNSL